MEAITSRELDAMTAEELMSFIDGIDVKQIDSVFNNCTFAAIKRAWEKYSGCRAVSTWSRKYTIFQFKESKWSQRRTDLLLGGDTTTGGSGVKATDLGERSELEQATADLVAALERLNAIKPVQFLDWESEYIYNYLGVRVSEEDDRLYVCISGEHDNLPSHEGTPLCNGRGQPYTPNAKWKG